MGSAPASIAVWFADNVFTSESGDRSTELNSCRDSQIFGGEKVES